jgi:hypothetical protein
MEKQKYAEQMQREMIEEVEKANPKYLIFVDVRRSWLIDPSSDKHIFRWFDQYSRKKYDLTGVVDIGDGGNTQYRWGNEAKSYSPRSTNNLLIFKRKT